MVDEGHRLTDKLLQRIERDVTKEYRQAATEVMEKTADYFRRFEMKDRKWQEWVKEGKKTQAEYTNWRIGQTMVGKRWMDFRDGLAKDLTNADQIARSIAYGHMPEAYSLNHNYATYQVEHDGGISTSYTLYNRETVERLIREEELQLLPPSRINIPKDLRWNKQHVQSALLQGIIQGESIPKLAGRLSSVAEMDRKAAIRNARTMVTGAQNAGRYDAFRRAKKLGINLTIEWQATLDERTRTSHRKMHGQRREVDEPFEVDGVKIIYPGYPEAPQEQIWNCRCTLLSWVKGYEGETVTTSPKMQGMSFDDWLKATPKPHRIDEQEKKSEAIRQKYIKEYREL